MWMTDDQGAYHAAGGVHVLSRMRLRAEEAHFCPDCGTSLDQFRADRAPRTSRTGATSPPAARPALRTTGSRGKRSRADRNVASQAPCAAAARRTSLLSPPAPEKPRPLPRGHLDGLRHGGGDRRHRSVRGHPHTIRRFRRAPGAGQTAGPIAADVSGSYSVLVERANGLYDQGAQAFEKKEQTAGVQYFAAAAKVYRAAWKQRATDPSMGTDYATSLFYSGDTEGALKQVSVVIAKSPAFQTAHLNKGIYLQTASQDAQQSGQKAKADSLLAQAKAEFQKAIVDRSRLQRRREGGREPEGPLTSRHWRNVSSSWLTAHLELCTAQRRAGAAVNGRHRRERAMLPTRRFFRGSTFRVCWRV